MEHFLDSEKYAHWQAPRVDLRKTEPASKTPWEKFLGLPIMFLFRHRVELQSIKLVPEQLSALENARKLKQKLEIVFAGKAEKQLQERMRNELAKSFANPITDELLAEYEQLSTQEDEQFFRTGQHDQALIQRLDDFLNQHSAVAHNSNEFYELLRQMNQKYGSENLDFIEMYFVHELAHQHEAIKYGYHDHGFRTLIFRDHDDLQFMPAHACSPPDNMSRIDYYQTQLRILSAPESDMSNADRDEFLEFSRKLQQLGVKPQIQLPKNLM